jgi:LuxR family maltose regulon positive regulatory protein
VIASRDDPQLALPRLRADGKLFELREADLRFTPSEAAAFLTHSMALTLSVQDIELLETRTEGWIAGLQLAAISLQGHQHPAELIRSFSGSHHFVLDYLLEEVLQQQPAAIQDFLLRTSILDRLCGPLCDAILQTVPGTGQETIEYLARSNLFIVPLDHERRWYRYHHLFSDLLRQRFGQMIPNKAREAAALHNRASAWYEESDHVVPAFQHAAAAMNVQAAERLIGRKDMPLHSHGVVTMILDWLASLPKATLDANPAFWVRRATLSLVSGQTKGVENDLQAAESALQNLAMDAKNRNLHGEIAAARATLALTKYQIKEIISQAQRAQAYLAEDNLAFRFTAGWTLAFAYQLCGDRKAACSAYMEAISISQASGDTFSLVLASSGLGQIQELNNQYRQAEQTYLQILRQYGEHPQPNISEIQLGLARIYYEWNELEPAEEYARQSLQLSRQYDLGIDRFMLSQIFLARIALARGDVANAESMISEANQLARQNNFVHCLPDIAAMQILIHLQKGDTSAAAQLAQTYALPLSQARVLLAQGDTSTALQRLEELEQQYAEKDWQDEYLKCTVLQALAAHTIGDNRQSLQYLEKALKLAEPGGFVRTFLDEEPVMAGLLAEARGHDILPAYVGKLLTAFSAEPSAYTTPQNLIEPLSPRELQVLQLITQGYSNQQISETLFLALDTVKGHNRRIFDKLQVQRRTEAIARAHDLGLV